MKIEKAIFKINPDAKFSVKGIDIDTCEILWIDTEEIDKETIKSSIIEVENEEVLKDEEQKTRYQELSNNVLSNLTMDKAEEWIDKNVTDMASAKIALKKIVRLILART